MERSFSRRTLLAAGAAAAVTAAAASAALADEAQATAPLGTVDPETGRYIPSFMTAPEPYAAWDEELDCDVAVVGLGVAGICATRAAMEEGVEVVAIEQCPDFSYRSAQFAGINSSVHKACGCEFDEDQIQAIVRGSRQPAHLGALGPRVGPDSRLVPCRQARLPRARLASDRQGLAGRD